MLEDSVIDDDIFAEQYGQLLKDFSGFEISCRHFLGDLDTRYFVITYTSIVLTAAVGFYLYFNQKLQMHPYPLYALEILACAAYYQSFMNLLLFHTITQTIFPFLFKALPIQSYQFKLIALKSCWIFSLFLNLTLVYSYPLLNLILYMDLEWIIVNPFYP